MCCEITHVVTQKNKMIRTILTLVLGKVGELNGGKERRK